MFLQQISLALRTKRKEKEKVILSQVNIRYFSVNSTVRNRNSFSSPN